MEWFRATGMLYSGSDCPGRAVAARTIWRAGLLASGHGFRRRQIRVAAPDSDSLTVLVEGARVIRVTVRSTKRANGYSVIVDGHEGTTALLSEVGAGGHAETWVNGQ